MRFTIAYIITRSDVIGGAQVHVRDLAVRLTQEGHRAVVLVGGSGPLTADLTRAGIEWYSVRSLVHPICPAKDIAAFAQVVTLLRRIKPDLVSAHTAKAGWLGRLASRLLGIPVVFTAHGWSLNPDRLGSLRARVFRIAECLAGRMANRIINVCERERELALQFGVADESVLCTVHNGMPDITRSLRSNPGVTPPRIIMVARMERPKDHETLLRALAGLLTLNWTLDLVGDGPLRPHICRLINELGLTSRVSMLGDCKWAVAEQLSHSQIFALISDSEAFPRSILEAMRAGLPVVATDLSGVNESVTDGVTGYLIPKRDSTTLRQRLCALISDPVLRARLGQAGRVRYETAFTFEQMFVATLAIYRSVLPRRYQTAQLAPGCKGVARICHSIRRSSP